MQERKPNEAQSIVALEAFLALSAWQRPEAEQAAAPAVQLRLSALPNHWIRVTAPVAALARVRPRRLQLNAMSFSA